MKKIRTEVEWFSEKMEEKLSKNDHKGGWKNLVPGYLRKRLIDELNELDSALFNHNYDDVVSECVDIANFAMMIADNYEREKNNEKNQRKTKK